MNFAEVWLTDKEGHRHAQRIVCSLKPIQWQMELDPVKSPVYERLYALALVASPLPTTWIKAIHIPITIEEFYEIREDLRQDCIKQGEYLDGDAERRMWAREPCQ